MSSFYTAEQQAWANPDICDIVSPAASSKHALDAYNRQQNGVNLGPENQANHAHYVIPGFNPSAIPQPEAAGTVQWSSPAEEAYFDERQEKQAPQYYQTGAYDPNFQHVTRFETDSSSSISSHHQAAQVSSNSSDKDKNSKPKRQRGKVLNDAEADLIQKDDSLLSDEELVIKRKAQNRLAQRAFRERKESKLKELQQKLLESEGERQRLLDVLDEIKQQFISVKTENQVLRNSSRESQGSKFTFPQSQEAFVEHMMSGQHHEIIKDTVSKIYDEPQHPGQKVLAVGAVWDYLQFKIEEEEYENIDMMEVMQALKGTEVCHGYGPAYPLAKVDAALRAVADKYNQ